MPLNIVDMSDGGSNVAVIGGSSLYLIDAGAGNDTITLPAPTDGSGASIVEGSPSDTLVLTGTSGNDSFSVFQSTIDSPGRVLTYSGINQVSIDTGDGNDTVQINAPARSSPSVTVKGVTATTCSR